MTTQLPVTESRMVTQTGPHVEVPKGLPGIEALVAFKPSTGTNVMSLVQELLRGPSPLSPAHRELIAAYVSTRNRSAFCSRVHTTTAARLSATEPEEVADTLDHADRHPDPKLRSLLSLAGVVLVSGNAVNGADIARAREAGATDEEIHDTVLIAAAFCMINRYVDGLAAPVPGEASVYEHIARELTDRGYAPA